MKTSSGPGIQETRSRFLEEVSVLRFSLQRFYVNVQFRGFKHLRFYAGEIQRHVSRVINQRCHRSSHFAVCRYPVWPIGVWRYARKQELCKTQNRTRKRNDDDSTALSPVGGVRPRPPIHTRARARYLASVVASEAIDRGHSARGGSCDLSKQSQFLARSETRAWCPNRSATETSVATKGRAR